MVLGHTGSSDKAVKAYGLWFLCPLVIYMSAVQAQFDCISALFMLLCVLLLKRDYCFLAGVMFALGSLIKFFPAFCIFLLCLYIFKVHSERRIGLYKFLMALLGALLAVALIFLPQCLDGTLGNAFSFIFGRTSEFNVIAAARTYPAIVFTLIMMLILALYTIRQNKDQCQDKFMALILLMLASCVIISSGPQYCIVYLPILAFYIYSEGVNRPLLYAFIIITVTSTISAFFNNSLSLCTTLVEYCGIWSPEQLLSAMDVLETDIFGITLRTIMVTLAEVIQTIFMIILILLVADDLGLLKRFSKVLGLSNKIRMKLGGEISEKE